MRSPQCSVHRHTACAAVVVGRPTLEARRAAPTLPWLALAFPGARRRAGRARRPSASIRGHHLLSCYLRWDWKVASGGGRSGASAANASANASVSENVNVVMSLMMMMMTTLHCSFLMNLGSMTMTIMSTSVMRQRGAGWYCCSSSNSCCCCCCYCSTSGAGTE